MTTDAMWALLLDQAARERAPLLVVGPEPVTNRLLGGLVVALRGQHVMAIPAAPDVSWASAGDAAVIVPDPERALDLASVVRACLRQDPDGFVVQAPRAGLPWQLLAQAALTGHQLVLHVRDAADEEAALADLRAALGADGLRPCQVLPWLVVLDEAGVSRLVVTDGALGDGAVVAWRRGDPVPADLYELWPASRPTRAAPVPVESAPPEPLDPEAVERVRAHVAPRVRTAFAPVCEPSTGDAARSKLGGVPMLAAGEAWPACACGRAMPLALQLARGEVPSAAQVCFPAGAGWLQLFYCCDASCGVEDAWTARAPNKRLRFLSAADSAAPGEVPELPDADWTPQDVVRWEELTDTPSSEDLVDAPRDVLDDRSALAEHARLDPDLAHLAGPRRGDKLLGWPAWAQAPEWQTCPRCAARMEPLFQLDADGGALTMLFAADGTGHVTQCPTHLDELAFAWACG